MAILTGTYAIETQIVTEKDKQGIQSAETTLHRRTHNVRREGRIRNEDIQAKLNVVRLDETIKWSTKTWKEHVGRATTKNTILYKAKRKQNPEDK